MSMRSFFLLSLALAVLVVGLEVAAMSLHRRGDRAIETGLLSSLHEVGVAKWSEGQKYLNLATTVSVMGIALALAGLVCVIISARKREPAWRSLTFTVLLLFLALQFYAALQFFLT